MDPTATLHEIRELVANYRRDDQGGPGHPNQYDDARLERLVELVEALDEWHMNGGFPPQQWRTGNIYFR